MAFTSAGASSNWMGRAKSSTSFTTRFSRADLLVDVGHGLAQRGGADLGLPQRVQGRLDDHQGIPHLVRDHGREPAERREPLLLRNLALEARDRIGQRVEGRGQQARILVVPPVPARQDDLARQIPGGGDFAHRVGDGRQGARDRAGYREAEEQGEQGGDEGRHGQLAAERSEEPQLLGPRAQDQGDRPAAGRPRRGARGQRQRERDVLLGPERHVEVALRPAEELRERGPVLGRQRRRQDLPVHAEPDVAAGHLLQLARQRLVEQEPHAERAENVGTREADRDRHRDQLQHAGGLRQQAEAVAARDGVADGRLARDDERRRRRGAHAGEHLSRPVRHEQQRRIELLAVAVDDVLHRRRVIGVHGRLQPGILRDQPGPHRERLGAVGAQLLDDRAGRHDLPLQRVLELPGHADADDVDGGADGEHREQSRSSGRCGCAARRAGSSEGKFSSVAAPSGTVAAARLEGSALVPRDHPVGPRRYVVDPVPAVGIGHREERMAEHQDEGIHVGVDVAEHPHDARAVEAHGLRAPGRVAARDRSASPSRARTRCGRCDRCSGTPRSCRW